MRVKMKAERDYIPADEPTVTVKFREGCEYTVKREWGEEMVKAGEAEEIDPPKRELTPAQIKALDRDEDGKAGGSKPKADAQA